MMQINEYHKRITLQDRLTWNLILFYFLRSIKMQTKPIKFMKTGAVHSLT